MVHQGKNTSFSFLDVLLILVCDNSLVLSFTLYLLYVIKIITMKIAAGQSTSTLYKDKTNPIFSSLKRQLYIF